MSQDLPFSGNFGGSQVGTGCQCNVALGAIYGYGAELLDQGFRGIRRVGD
jgi:hypothetical protein